MTGYLSKTVLADGSNTLNKSQTQSILLLAIIRALKLVAVITALEYEA